MPENMGFPMPPDPEKQDFMAKLTAALGGPQGLMQLGGNLLAASGPSQQRVGFGQALGQGLLANQQFQQQSGQDALQAMLIKSQIERNKARQTQVQKPVAVLDPVTGKPKLVGPEEAVGMEPFYSMNRAEAPAILQEYGQYATDEKAAGRAPKPYMDWLPVRAKSNVGAPFVLGDFAGGRAMFNRTDPADVRQLTTAEQEALGAGTIAGGTATGKGAAERGQTFINEGLAAADSLPTLNRAIELLDTVSTGGLNNLKLWASNNLGVTGADEAELSANMGKAVLSQLRSTFGAAFTEREGERLQNIEAGFGKSTQGNKRLLQQAQKLVERAARRGMEAARKSGDTFSADEISKSIGLRLSDTPNETPTAGPAGSSNIDALLDKYAPKK